jgi:hypothetical protein
MFYSLGHYIHRRRGVVGRSRFWRGLPVAAAFLFQVAGASPHAGGYLPRIGPSALRFQLPPPPMVLVSLPPLKKQEEIPDPTPARLEVKKEAPRIVPQAVTNSAASALPAAPVQTNSVPMADGSTNTLDASFGFDNAGQPVIPSQKLVSFFRSLGTNGSSDVHLAIPDGFAPPPPAGPPSSSATYNGK